MISSIEPTAGMILPFALLLAAMALGPACRPVWWSRHYPKVALGLGAATAGYYLFGSFALQRLVQVGHEYISFIVLIGSLFVVAGGIHLQVKGQSTPGINTLFLFFGALAANLLGTTGASVLLIRPWLRFNQSRVAAHHIVFFIFLVSNVGGCLTPVGDPPLFLGYLKGIPFWWVTAHCWPMWTVAVGFLLGLFYVLDRIQYRRASDPVRDESMAAPEQWRLVGLGNVAWLVLILGALFLSRPAFLREGVMAAAAALSYLTTRRSVREANRFSFHPVQEVAILFAGLFATMMPALDWLQHQAGQLRHLSPACFYWSTGLLSSLLDNAPTYLSFLSVIPGLSAPPPGVRELPILPNHDAAPYLLAVSLGAVFFGAMTYIGNGPNFIVKAIADQQGVRTPGFLGFVFKFSAPCLLPLLILIWLLFLRR